MDFVTDNLVNYSVNSLSKSLSLGKPFIPTWNEGVKSLSVTESILGPFGVINMTGYLFFHFPLNYYRKDLCKPGFH